MNAQLRPLFRQLNLWLSCIGWWWLDHGVIKIIQNTNEKKVRKLTSIDMPNTNGLLGYIQLSFVSEFIKNNIVFIPVAICYVWIVNTVLSVEKAISKIVFVICVLSVLYLNPSS